MELIVFFLCGLWHGSSGTFVIWGLFHGAFSFLEEYVSGIRKLPRVLGHIYTMLVVCIGFVIFRADTLGEAVGMIGRMFTGFDFSPAVTAQTAQLVTPYFIVMLIMGILFCAPAETLVKKLKTAGGAEVLSGKGKGVQAAVYCVSVVLLAWCIIRLSGGSYNPFIYFRF